MSRRSLVLVVAAVLLLAVGAWYALILSGFYNVAASEPHGRLVEWTVETVVERSVAVRAGELPAPLPTDEAALLHGLEHYRAMCAGCHGAPGVERDEIGAGLYPRPPRLQRAAAGWSDAELFWITKHGIKATGMPGFGRTHGDAELLQIVAFLRRLADMDEQDYASSIAALDSAGIPSHDAAGEAGDAGHSHAPGTAPHSH